MTDDEALEAGATIHVDGAQGEGALAVKQEVVWR
jgi:hypothetical protein